MKSAVIIFPGSNRERDIRAALQRATGRQPILVWHRDTTLPPSDLIVLPGGFAYGDYLRCGAMAAHSPIMNEVRDRAAKGTPVLGICNGFQILCESGLLPGALMRNAGLKYICKPVHIRVENTNTPYTQQLTKGEVLEIPIGHMEGNYFCDEQIRAELKDQERIIFRYVTLSGEVTAEANPNGSIESVAGICNEGRNVLGMMPHPERASEPELGMTDGVRIFDSLVSALVTK